MTSPAPERPLAPATEALHEALTRLRALADDVERLERTAPTPSARPLPPAVVPPAAGPARAPERDAAVAATLAGAVLRSLRFSALTTAAAAVAGAMALSVLPAPARPALAEERTLRASAPAIREPVTAPR